MSKNNYTCGIDEAGRGPVLGPLVIACALFDKRGKQKIIKLGVRDSKKIPPKKREKLEKEIKKIALEWNLIKLYPQDIDRLRKRFSLNLIEAIYASELILSLKNKPEKVIIDSPDSVEDNFKGKIEGYLLAHLHESQEIIQDRLRVIPKIISENKADDKYPEVSAASILAKVERDREIKCLKEKHGECGSGYSSDVITQNFLKKLFTQEELPSYVRKSWITTIRGIEKKNQKKLGEFE